MPDADPVTDASAAGDPALTSDWVALDDVRLHVVSGGSGKPLLFLHGFPEFWYGWHRQLRHFKTDWRVAAPDMRGYNLSDKPAGLDAYRMRLLVGDVVGLIGHLGVDRINLVAHDWGGVVAWALALQRPELIERLVILNAPHPWIFNQLRANDPAQAEASRYITWFDEPHAETALSKGGFDLLARQVSSDAEPGPFRHPGDRALYRAAWSQPGALTAMLNYYRTMTRAGPLLGEADDYRVTVPTLIIWGERDRALLPANLDGIEALVPDLELVRVPTATHWIAHDAPDVVNAAIESFLGR